MSLYLLREKQTGDRFSYLSGYSILKFIYLLKEMVRRNLSIHQTTVKQMYHYSFLLLSLYIGLLQKRATPFHDQACLAEPGTLTQTYRCWYLLSLALSPFVRAGSISGFKPGCVDGSSGTVGIALYLAE